MYRTIFTNYGRAKIANANATGEPLNLTHMAVGDGDGAAVEPSEEQTALVNEIFRVELSALYQDAEDPTKFIAEAHVPNTEGGFTVRELGLFDEDGELVAVANTPQVYKPTSAEGAFSDTAFRMIIHVSNAASITLSVDTSLVSATTAYVDAMLAGYYTSGEVDSLLSAKVAKAGDTMTGKLGVVSVDATVEDLGTVSGEVEIDVSLASTFVMVIDDDTEFDFTNEPEAGRDQVTYLKITDGGDYTITWPDGTLFAGGEAPTLTEGGTDLVGIWYDADEEAWVVGVIFADYKGAA